ncbi:hypothetical protein ACFE04_019616 [Oxalis oulophora]
MAYTLRYPGFIGPFSGQTRLSSWALGHVRHDSFLSRSRRVEKKVRRSPISEMQFASVGSTACGGYSHVQAVHQAETAELKIIDFLSLILSGKPANAILLPNSCSKAPEKRLMEPFYGGSTERCTLWESERPFRQTGVGVGLSSLRLSSLNLQGNFSTWGAVSINHRPRIATEKETDSVLPLSEIMKVPGIKQWNPVPRQKVYPLTSQAADGRAKEKKEVRRSDYLLLLESMTDSTSGLGSSGGLLGRPDPYLVKVVAWLAPHPLSCVSVGAVCASVLALALWFSVLFRRDAFLKDFFPHRPTILDLANSGADGDSPIDSTDSDLDAPAHKHMDRDADSDAARKARLSDS